MPLFHKVRNFSFAFIYLLCLLFNCVHAYKHPLYNWDVLPYMAIIKNYEKRNVDIHDTIYKIAKAEIPQQSFKNFVDSTIAYRWQAAKNSNFFEAQLEFYRVKPLYTGLAFIFYKSGFSLTKSTVLPSIVSYFLLGMLVFFWLAKFLGIRFAFLLSMLLMFSSPLMEVAGLPTPDAMAALFVLTGIYGLVEMKSIWVCFSFLLFAIFIRIDNILPCLLILLSLAFANRWTNRLSLPSCLLMMSVALVCVILTPYIFSLHFFRPTSFFKHLKPFTDLSSGFSLNSYASLIKSQIATGLYFSSLSLFLFLASLLLITTGFKFRLFDSDQILISIIFLVILLRFILQPAIANRFYIPYYLCIAVLIAKKFAVRIYP